MKDLRVTVRSTPRLVNRWIPPPTTVVKANFDASFNQAESRSSTRVAFRDKKGEILVSAGFIHTQVRSVFEAKALACWDTVKLGVNLRYQKLIVEGDYLSVIKKCKKQDGVDRLEICAFIRN